MSLDVKLVPQSVTEDFPWNAYTGKELHQFFSDVFTVSGTEWNSFGVSGAVVTQCQDVLVASF